MRACYIGVDLGGTKIATGAGDQTGAILVRDVRPTEAHKGTEATINNIKASIRQVLEQLGPDLQVCGIGVGSPGPLSVSEGVVYSAPNLGWDHVPIRQILKDEFGVRVEVGNDANVAGLAEWRFGAGEQCRNMIYVTVSTGIGGGIIVDGKLLLGSHDFAGEIGHMIMVENGPLCGCGRRGCFETLASGTAIARRAQEAVRLGVPTAMLELVDGDIDRIDSAVVARADAAGDALASEILDEAIRYLSIGLGNLVTIFNPDRIVIGGGVSNIGDRLFRPLRRMILSRAMRESVSRVEIHRAKLGSDVGVVGAMCLVMD
ncbi:MAG: ROK family protein [Bacillota bacterium]|nr:ROK family protein [Bacillota bacterium]HOB91595.1 ROK family protein [Bacillota bacterium]HPZ54487.1 ROK family protein [Bacillota bacterium]HQD17823.1 ROK family protein [Bacillota bacterium]